MDNDTGKPDVSQIEPVSRGVYQGNGWMYNQNSDALMLKSGTYDFNYTSPGYRTGDHLNCVNVNHIFVQLDATIVGGMFNGQSLLNHGTVKNSLLSNDIERGGTMTNCLFKCSNPPVGVANYHKLTEVNNSEFEVTLLNAPSGFTGCETYYFTGTPTLRVKLSSNKEITCINGEKLYGNLSGPDTYGYYTFTPKAGDDVVLNRKPYATDLVMTTDGIPDTSNAASRTEDNKTIWYGTDWTYDGDTLTLESGSYDFTYTKPSDATSTRYSNTVRCNVVVNKGAAITGGKFSGDTFSNSGTVKDILFMGKWITNNGTLSCLFGLRSPSGTGFTRHTMTAVDGSKIYYTVNQHLSIGGVYKLYFTGTPKFTVRLENSTIHYINGEEHYGGLTSPDGKGYQTFTPQIEEDIVLNREPYATDLVITEGGFPDTEGREPIYQDNDPTKQVIGCKGNGWKYEIGNVSNTLTLESGSYDFTNTKPITKDGDPLEYLNVDLIVNEGVTITGGIFWLPVVSNSCTIQNSSFLKSFENHGGTVTNSIFLLQPTGVECCTLSAVDGSPITFVPNYPSPVIDYIICNRSTYYFTGTPKFTVKLKNSTIHYINGRIDYGGLTSPDGKGYQTFTPQAGDDVVLNDTIIHEPFTMTNGYPTASNGGKTACKGEGWEYILGNPEHGDFLFLSNAQIDFSKISDGSPVECKLFIGYGVAVQGGTFNGDVINNGGILGGTFNGAVENHGTIANGVFNGAVTNIDPGTVSDSITGTGTLNGKPITARKWSSNSLRLVV